MPFRLTTQDLMKLYYALPWREQLPGSLCERCGKRTQEISAVHQTYWVCPDCKRFHLEIMARAQRCREQYQT